MMQQYFPTVQCGFTIGPVAKLLTSLCGLQHDTESTVDYRNRPSNVHVQRIFFAGKVRNLAYKHMQYFFHCYLDE